MHVLIVGAGITGPLVGQGLKKEGIPFSIFESEASASVYRSREWAMSLHWGLPLLKNCLPKDRFDRLQSATIDPSYTPKDADRLTTLNGATGELIKDIPLPLLYRVSRRKLRALCAEDIDIQYGKSIKDVKYDDSKSTVTAVFEDGSEATGSLLVGTDGAQSKVRTLIFGSEKAKAQVLPQYYAIVTHVAYNDAEKAKYLRETHPSFYNTIHPERQWMFVSITDVPDPDDLSTCRIQLFNHWMADDPDEDVTSLANFKARAEAFVEPFKSAVLWIPEGTKIYQNKLSYWMPELWDNKGGRIILAGDAGHPMTYNRGQGMNHGIADASSLTLKLLAAHKGETTVQQAVDSYCEEMVDRGGEEVRVSLINTEMLLDWDRLMQSPIMQRGAAPKESKEVTK